MELRGQQALHKTFRDRLRSPAFPVFSAFLTRPRLAADCLLPRAANKENIPGRRQRHRRRTAGNRLAQLLARQRFKLQHAIVARHQQ